MLLGLQNLSTEKSPTSCSCFPQTKAERTQKLIEDKKPNEENEKHEANVKETGEEGNLTNEDRERGQAKKPNGNFFTKQKKRIFFTK